MTCKAPRLASLLLAILLLSCSGSLYAHTRLLASEPVSGAVLKSAPQRLVLHFSAPPESGFTSIQWAGEDFSQWHALEPVERENRIEAAMPRLAPGRYKIRWSVLSRDGHRQRGVLEFQIH